MNDHIMGEGAQPDAKIWTTNDLTELHKGRFKRYTSYTRNKG